MEHLDEERRENIGKYIRFLHDEDGWSDLIDSRWKDEVKDVLNKKFPEITEDEWKVLESLLFIRPINAPDKQGNCSYASRSEAERCENRYN